MKEEKRKKGKKRILLYYLILAVCILVIAAVTVTVVLAVNSRNNGLRIDNSIEDPDDNPGGNKDPENPDDPGVDTSTRTQFIFPVATVDVLQDMDFWHNETIDTYYRHRGIDFAGDVGDKVFAAIDGTVASVFYNNRLYGNYVTIMHDNGIFTIYKFIDPNTNLVPGMQVNRGDVIGTIAAATGNERNEGSHLHFEVEKFGKPVDPATYLDIENK